MINNRPTEKKNGIVLYEMAIRIAEKKKRWKRIVVNLRDDGDDR